MGKRAIKLTCRQQEYIRNNVCRINFTYRRKYDYNLYKFFNRLNEQYKKHHTEISRNKFVKDAITYDMSSEKDDIKTTKHLYQSFPEEMKCGTQFTITINKKTEKELYHHLHKIEEKQPLADYIRLAVYKYIQVKGVDI